MARDVPFRPAQSLPSTMQPGEPARLLVVEDESIIAMDLEDQLIEMGYRVCATVDNGTDAIASVEQHHPDLVLMDIVIKGEFDGVETARRIAQRFDVPIVFLTSSSDPTTLERAMKTAPYGYMNKPFQHSELHGSLETALYKSKLESRLRASERWFAATLRCAADGLLLTDQDGTVQFMSPAAELILNKPLSDSVGKPVDQVLILEGEPLAAFARGTEAVTADIAFGRFLAVPGAKRVPLDVSFVPLRDDAGAVTGTMVSFRDVSERVSAEVALQRSEDRFRAAFDLAPTGMALVALSGRFLQGNAAMLGLLGVGERELLGLAQVAVSNADDAAKERQQLHQLLSGERSTVQFERCYHRRDQTEVRTLVSVSLLTQRDQPLCYLYQVQDLAARALPGEPSQRNALRAQLGAELRHAVVCDELALFYQPIVDLTRGEVVHVEALLRWQHPSRGILLPRDFFALGEECGLSVPLAAITLTACCHAAARWSPALSVTANVSLRQLGSDDFEQTLRRALDESALSPHRLTLELPREVLLEHSSALIDKAIRLRSVGIAWAIDDFGIGPFELPLLQRLAPVRVSLRGALTQAMEVSTDDAAIVDAAVAAARALGLPVIAKWIETDRQRTLLSAAGCLAGSGMLFAEPRPLAALPSTLATFTGQRDSGSASG